MSRPWPGDPSHPCAGVPSNAGPIQRARCTGLAPSAIDHGLTGTRSGSVAKVASVGLPAMEKGLVIPNKPVAPISPKNRDYSPAAVKLENCGDKTEFLSPAPR